MSTTHKHTPGPWRIEGVERFYGTDAENVVLGALDKNPVAVVCDFNRYDRDTERDANARLIAAAPELLEACEAAYYAIEHEPLLTILRAAIAKATGGENG